MRGFLRAPRTTIKLPWQPKDDCGKRLKQQQMECLWKFFYVFWLSTIECMSIDLQKTWLDSFGQKLIRMFSLPSVKRAHCGAGSNSAHSSAEFFTDILAGFTVNNRVLRLPAIVLFSAELFILFVDVIGTFCCENPAGRGLFRWNSRKPLALAENNVYFSMHEQFKPCQGNSSNSTWSLGLRKRDGSGSSPDHRCIDLASFCHSSFLVLSSFFFFFPFFATKGDLDCMQMIESSLLKFYVWTFVRVFLHHPPCKLVSLIRFSYFLFSRVYFFISELKKLRKRITEKLTVMILARCKNAETHTHWHHNCYSAFFWRTWTPEIT